MKLFLPLLALALSSCYSAKPHFAVAHRPFHHGIIGGDARWDPTSKQMIRELNARREAEGRAVASSGK